MAVEGHRSHLAMDSQSGNGAPNVTPLKVESEAESKKVVRYPMARRGLGTKGNQVPLLTNHFKVDVDVDKVDGHFFHYNVALFYEDGRPVDGKGVGRKVLDRVRETYDTELASKEFAYDGEKSLFTVGSLPCNKLEFTVVVDNVTSSRNNGNESDNKRMRRPYQSKTFKVEISFAAKIPMQAIANALRGQESHQEALRVLDIILRQHAARQGCLLVRQSFFHNDAGNFFDVGGGVRGCRGFHSSFRITQSGLSLNTDVSTTMIIQPGPVLDFLVANQRVRDPSYIDWVKAKRTLKNLRVTTRSTNQEYKITGLSEMTCREQLFTLKQGNKEKEVTVLDYFVNHRKIKLPYSADLPCINVGKPKRPTYFPIELCSLVSLQRYTKALSTLQRASLVGQSRQRPQQRMSILRNALKMNNYSAEPMLRSCGVSINSSFTEVEGRLLQTPKLKGGYGEDLIVQNGRWNFNKKKFAEPCKIENWAVVNFSDRRDDYVRKLLRELKKVGEAKGIEVADPKHFFEEDEQYRQEPPLVRVEKMFKKMESKLSEQPKFLLCLLPQRKNSDLYGPWKRKSLSDFGVVTQCLAPPPNLNEQYLTNLLLKMNAKLGGVSSVLAPPSLALVSKIPTLILGMDVSHGSPGQSDIPSIAAVVSSREWPSICRYRAAVRTQSPKLEMVDSLYKRVSETEDDGIMRELLLDFYHSSGKRRPHQIIIFRDGVSESQFNQVLNIELDQIIEACKFLDPNWSPKFMVIIAQKNHHTRFFQKKSPDNNVQPGTIVDNKVCHPRNYDFYLCAHAGMIGTTRPTHYHVLLDEIGFSPDELQELVHSLSYVYQRSTTAISVVAPICYAHLAATQLGQWMKFEDASETSSSHNGTGAAPPVPPMPKLKRNVRDSMYFC